MSKKFDLDFANQSQESIRYFDEEKGQWMVATVENGRMVSRPEAQRGNMAIVQQATADLYDSANYIYLRELQDLENQRIAEERAIRLRYEGKLGGKQRANKSIFDFNREVIDPARKAIEARHVNRKSQAGDSVFMASVKLVSIATEQATESGRLDGEAELAGKRGKQAVDSAKTAAHLQDIADQQVLRTERTRIELAKDRESHTAALQLREQESTQSHQLSMQQEESKTRIKIAEVATVAESERRQYEADRETIRQAKYIAGKLGDLQAQIELAQASTPEKKLEKLLAMQMRLREYAGLILDPANSTFEEQLTYSKMMVSDYESSKAMLLPLLQDESNRKP